MSFKINSFVALIILTTLLISCTSTPKLYPNEKYESVSKDIANQDIKDCMKKADQYVSGERTKNTAKGAGAGAVIGGAIGAGAGLLTGHLLGGALVGAAAGGAGGAAAGAMSPEKMKRRFTEKCLSKKGYEVLGWD